MMIKTALAGTVAALVLASGAFAQTAPAPQNQQNQQRPAQPANPAAPAQTAPRSTAPAPAAAPVATQRPAQQGQLVNLNTAPETELDKLPQIGPARAKAIIEARTKNGRFKDWNDFVARNVVPKNAEDAIKDKIRF